MNCVIYTRISLDRSGEELAVARQEEECRALAERLGLRVVTVFTDNDLSATSGKARPSFEAMLESQPGAIVAWHQDRLLRLTRDLERVISLNVPVYTVTAGTLDLTTPAGRAVARTVAAWSQYEGEQKALRQVAANTQRAASGLHSGRVGYGYRRVNGEIELHNEEAETIREAVSRVLNGESLRSVCKDFDARAEPTPGRGAAWNTTTLKQLLLRPSLAGLTVHQGKVMSSAPADVPRVIDSGTHEQLKAVLNNPARRTAPAGRAPKYLLGGVARCGLCGGSMRRAVGRKTTTKAGGAKRQPPSYVCGDCHRVRRKQSDVDSVVEGVLIGRLQLPDAMQLFTQGDPDELQRARAALDEIDAKLVNGADMFATGAIDAAQLAWISARLRSERLGALAKLEAAMPSSMPTALIGDAAADTWQGLDMDTKRAILDLLLTVTIMPSGSGRSFDPATVQIEWRR